MKQAPKVMTELERLTIKCTIAVFDEVIEALDDHDSYSVALMVPLTSQMNDLRLMLGLPEKHNK